MIERISKHDIFLQNSQPDRFQEFLSSHAGSLTATPPVAPVGNEIMLADLENMLGAFALPRKNKSLRG